jgi:uncharacterized membrane protein
LLVVLLLLYVGIFASLAFAQHAGMRTHKADLGQIDQAVWNSSRGRFVESTDYGYIASRLTDHVEPMLALISPVLWLWDDVRALLLLQVLFVAVGAVPLYALAVRLMDRTLTPVARTHIWEIEPLHRLTKPLALTLVVAYLLASQLQSAVLTEFHAAPLAVPFILWALWAVEAKRWGQAAVAVLLVAAVKEETALLAAGFGLWMVWRGGLLAAYDTRHGREPKLGSYRTPVLLGVGLALASLVWFYVATFVIVPAHAVQVYGAAESSYFRRYGALGDSPLDILRSLVTRPALVWAIATEPARLAYLRGLVAPFGFLALLAPEVIALSLPVLLANLLSAYPAQYYGEFHYSAPVMVYCAAAAAFGLARLWRPLARRLGQSSASFQHLPAASPATMAAVALTRNSRTALRPLLAVVLGLWILGWALHSYAVAGRGPGGGRYDPTPVTAHHRLLERFTAQIPADAAVTATAAVHPHVSHRRYVYQFPIGLEPPGQAEWALLDVTTATDMAPGDLRSQVEAMLAGEWGVVDAADGFLLLRKGEPNKTIPLAFYDFARTPGAASPGAPPLTFAGVEVLDWPRWRQSWVTTRWTVGEGFDSAGMTPALAVRSPAQETLYGFADVMPPALVWYPPQAWQPGDRLHLTTPPLDLPESWGVVVARTPGLAWPPATSLVANHQSALLAAYGRDETGELATLDGLPVEGASHTVAATFALDGSEPLTLTAGLDLAQLWPGAPLDLWLNWQGDAWPAGAEVFVHLRRDGVNQDQQDGVPRFFIPYEGLPSPLPAGGLADWRQLRVPGDAQPGEWTVAVGLYDPATGQRFLLADGAGDELVLGPLPLGEPPTPDQACALVPASCAGQP